MGSTIASTAGRIRKSIIIAALAAGTLVAMSPAALAATASPVSTMQDDGDPWGAGPVNGFGDPWGRLGHQHDDGDPWGKAPSHGDPWG